MTLTADGVGRAIFSPVAWDDLQVTLGTVKLPGVSDPSWVAYKGGRLLSFSKSSDNIITFTGQLSHSYKLESDLEFHIHVVYPDANAGNSKWVLTYSWAGIGGDFPAETPTPVTIASPANADAHTLHEVVAVIDGTGKSGLSSMLICSLMREGTDVADTYDNAIYLVGLDFHFQKDTIGSLLEKTK